MTIAKVIGGDVVLFAIPPAPKRRMPVQEPPAALSEGVSARFGAEDDLPAGRAEHFGVAAVAAVGEKAGGLELLTRRDRLSRPRPEAAPAGLGAGGAWRGGSGLFGRCRCRPSSNSAGCRTSRRIACSSPSRRLRSRGPPVSQGSARARAPRGSPPRCTGGFCFCREPSWKNYFKRFLKKSGKAAGHLLPVRGFRVGRKYGEKNYPKGPPDQKEKVTHRL